MSIEAPEILLAHYLRTLKLPTFQRKYQKLAGYAPPKASITSDTCSGFPKGR